ncbi:hypothetical protein V3C10_16530 [[Clostridium] symbiosum]|uniref:hypothetical protein n=1 Tax=Clostridium symbiosum TaxID=1512 RepID=UPI001D08798E|nr:hypothetical protein [[Clostridium] symbiosum]MCB6608441.1 hypothetical protein [[Clostridium] symbiosum]MCB6930655.1 hypothetical protein [[Clostridium] symbiosum]
MREAIISIITFCVFYFSNFVILSGLGALMKPEGDPFINSYLNPVYSGMAALAAIIIVCTCIIVRKLDEVLKELKKDEYKSGKNKANANEADVNKAD